MADRVVNTLSEVDHMVDALIAIGNRGGGGYNQHEALIIKRGGLLIREMRNLMAFPAIRDPADTAR